MKVKDIKGLREKLVGIYEHAETSELKGMVEECLTYMDENFKISENHIESMEKDEAFELHEVFEFLEGIREYANEKTGLQVLIFTSGILNGKGVNFTNGSMTYGLLADHIMKLFETLPGLLHTFTLKYISDKVEERDKG